jgi:hypothetical protein
MVIIQVSVFEPADELDGPLGESDSLFQEPAVALRFPYNPAVVELLKRVFRGARPRRAPLVGGWSAKSRCWWVRSPYWPTIRKSLLVVGVELSGPAAHPRRREAGFWGEEEQTWDARRCEWSWEPPSQPRWVPPSLW